MNPIQKVNRDSLIEEKLDDLKSSLDGNIKEEELLFLEQRDPNMPRQRIHQVNNAVVNALKKQIKVNVLDPES